jgi:hypothetical protein
MIEISGDILKIRDISPFLSSKPVDALFSALLKIWRDVKTPVKEHYRQGEGLSLQLEDAIYRIYPEIYDYIIKAGREQRKIIELTGGNSCLIVMDGMSIREVGLVKPQNGYRLSISYAYSEIPSETEFFILRNFGCRSVEELKRKDMPFQFIHLMREEDMERIGDNKTPLLIWSIFPDKLFSEFTIGFETPDLSRVFEYTSRILDGILERVIGFERIIITSDHGYFVDTYSWEGLRDFPSAERYTEVIPEHLKRYCRQVADWWVLFGRYNTIKRGRYVHIRHGGLSFLECIVPLIMMERGEQNGVY